MSVPRSDHTTLNLLPQTVRMSAFFALAVSMAVAAFMVPVSKVKADESGLNLSGNMVQGGLIHGQLDAGSKLWLDGEEIAVAADGAFVFGVGRDAKESYTLTWQKRDGGKGQQVLTIEPRQWKIERVDGLPPKTVTPPKSWLERRKKETGRVVSGRKGISDDQHWLSGFIWPASGRVSGVYGSQRILNGNPRSPHYGLDVAAPKGVPVVAPAAGIVTLAAKDFLLEGGIVIIDHGMGVTSTLFHMDDVLVEEGQMVAAGDEIGKLGDKGRATGPHVDWRVNWYKVRLDPYLLVKDKPMPEKAE